MDDWETISTGGWRWRIRPAWRDRLLVDGRLPIETWRANRCLDVIKQGPHRVVFRARIGTDIFIKHHPGGDWKSRLRHLFRWNPAAREADTAERLQRLGIATARPVAVGEGPGGECYFVTEAVPDVRPVWDWIENPPTGRTVAERTRLRIALADALATLVARMHDRGVVHRDLHAGNILARLNASDEFELYLIDLHEVRFRRRLGWRQSRTNLALLNRWFIQRSDRTDRLRFWRRYVALRWGDDLHTRRRRLQARELERLTWRSCLRYWRRRDGRYLTSNRHFRRLSASRCAALATADWADDVQRHLLGNPELPLNRPEKILKHSRSSTVALVRWPGRVTAGIVYKRINCTQWTDRWQYLVRPTPALRSWLNGHRLRECGLPTPRPLAVLHTRRLGLITGCYLATPFLPHTCSLREHVDRLHQCGDPERQRRIHSLVEQVARLVRRMHDRHLSHRDLKAANLLVQTSGSEEATVHLIDLVGCRRYLYLSRSRRVADLARLNVSFLNHPAITPADKLRFLRIYMAWGLRGKRGWKRWWREVEKATVKKLLRNRKRNRPIS